MNNARLIRKFGSPIVLDGETTNAYFNSVKKSYYIKKLKEYTSFDVEVIHTVKDVSLESVLSIRNDNFIVYDVSPVYTRGKISYIESVVIKDDFDKPVNIKLQSLNGCSLPSIDNASSIAANARIKTVNPVKYLNFALQGEKVPTHTITIRYVEGVQVGSLVEWIDRNFEILTIENIDEKNIFLVLNCIEVL